MNTKLLDSMKIDQSKFNTDGQQYFSIFEKYIPKNLEKNAYILLYCLNNEDCIMNIVALNPDANYIIFDHERLNYLKSISPNTKFSMFKSDKNNNAIDSFKDALKRASCMYNMNMKFDCIIMNPPYQRDLHLKILNEAYKHITQNGKVVCLHPSKWLQRFDYWKNKWNNFKIESAEFIDDTVSRTIFPSAAIGSRLVVTVLSEKGSTDIQNIQNIFHG